MPTPDPILQSLGAKVDTWLSEHAPDSTIDVATVRRMLSHITDQERALLFLLITDPLHTSKLQIPIERHRKNMVVLLYRWMPGDHSIIHSHGDSAGGARILKGTLTEITFTAVRRGVDLRRPDHAERVTWQQQAHAAGRQIIFPPEHIHLLANAGKEPAASLHAYTPLLIDDGLLYEVKDGIMYAMRRDVPTTP